MAFESKIDIRVVRFRPIGSVTTSTVEMALNNGQSSAGQEGVNDRNVVRLVGSYYIKVKRRGSIQDGDDSPEMRVKFTVSAHDDNPHKATETYMLQGVAFSNRDQTAPADPAKDNRLGQLDFTRIEIEGQGAARSFTITNSRLARNAKPGKPVSYDYMFLIQKVETGEIGIIDPEWENE